MEPSPPPENEALSRISVVMTTFEAGEHLEPQLASLVQQGRLPDEIVVFDDHSADDTFDRLQDFRARSPIPVRLHRQEANVGLRRNIAAALAASTGDIVVLSDQDDVWHWSKLESVERAFEDRDVALWFSDAALIDHDGHDLGETTWGKLGLGPESPAEMRRHSPVRLLVHGQTVTGATMAVRGDVVALGLPLPETLEGPDHLYLHDGWLAVLAVCLGAVVAEPRRLTSYRQHPAQVTAMSMTRRPDMPPEATASAHQRLVTEAARTALVAARLARGAVDTATAREVKALDAFLQLRLRASAGEATPREVLELLRSGSYNRFARGPRTAAKDLLRSLTSGRGNSRNPSGGAGASRKA